MSLCLMAASCEPPLLLACKAWRGARACLHPLLLPSSLSLPAPPGLQDPPHRLVETMLPATPHQQPPVRAAQHGRGGSQPSGPAEAASTASATATAARMTRHTPAAAGAPARVCGPRPSSRVLPYPCGERQVQGQGRGLLPSPAGRPRPPPLAPLVEAASTACPLRASCGGVLDREGTLVCHTLHTVTHARAHAPQKPQSPPAQARRCCDPPPFPPSPPPPQTLPLPHAAWARPRTAACRQNSSDVASNWTRFTRQSNYFGQRHLVAAFRASCDFWNWCVCGGGECLKAQPQPRGHLCGADVERGGPGSGHEGMDPDRNAWR